MEAAAVERLRALLAASSEAHRPVAKMDLPLKLGHLVTAKALALMKPAAVLVPIIRREAGYTVLLTRRAETLRQHKGQISFPGGRRDDTDESYAHAALREAQEEVGLPPSAVQVLGYLDDYPTMTGYRITPVVGYVETDFTLATDPGEVAEAFELPLSWLVGEDRFERKTMTRAGFSLPFLELRFGEHAIWGATAAILFDLRRQLAAG